MRVLLITLVAACASDPGPHPDWTYPQIPAEPQRAGDAAKGYDYLINGGYITCGIPKTAFDQVFGNPPLADKIDGRTGNNANLPFYYSAATSAEGVTVISANCLTCHASHLDGKVIVGLGSTEHDFTVDQAQYVDFGLSLVTDPSERAEYQRFASRVHAIGPYTKTLTVGANPADNLTAVLMSHRDPQTLAWSDTAAIELPPAQVVPVDVPPWWRMAKKSTMFYGAAGRGDHARIMMAASLLCTDTVEEAQRIDDAFVDVRAWIETLSAPKWPYAVDGDLAAKGKTVFDANCARCHGTYGDGGVYPNELVPIDDVGTDALLATGTTQFADRFVTWFNSSFWGGMSRLEPTTAGYIAPPLDGIWATAPYFHNGSVPTLAAVLDSSQRPAAWKRTFDSTAYDQAAVGWQFTVVPSHAQSPDPRAYDTSELGYNAGGHGFGDMLLPSERAAVLEYLKTL